MKAPLGWDNSTEMLATAVDSIRHLTDITVAVNSERSPDPLPRVVRPYEEHSEPVTTSLAAFGDLIKE